MSYLSEKETTDFIFPILNIYKSGRYKEVLTIIKENNIDPQHSENIISDYAALWLKEPEIIDFFKEMKKIGGNPIGHKSIFQNCLGQNKNKTVKYLISEGVLQSCEEYITYFINETINSDNHEGFDILNKVINISKYKLLNENNPSCLNRAIHAEKKDILNKLFKAKIVERFAFEKETVEFLERRTQEFKSWFIDNLSKKLKLKKRSKYFSTEYKDGDITTVLKVMQYDVLDGQLSSLENKKDKKFKI